MEIMIILNNQFSKDLTKWNQMLNSSNRELAFLRPFAGIFEYIHQNIKSKIADPYKVNLNAIQSIIFKDISAKLEHLLGRSIIFEMQLYKKKKSEGIKEDMIFYEFIDFMNAPSQLNVFMDKYPIVNKRLKQIVESYMSFLTNLINNYIQDYQEIIVFLGDGGESSYVLIDIDCSGDRHENYSAVSILTLGNGDKKYKLIYKPHDISIDIAFSKFVGWVNSLSDLYLKTQRYMDKNDYGWVEFINHYPCIDENEVKLYYKRFGALIFLQYLLCGIDINKCNLIANGCYPIIIDLECLLTPRINYSKSEEQVQDRNLVIYTGMLPRQRLVDAKGKGFDNSAFGKDCGMSHPHSKLTLAHYGNKNASYIRREGIIKKAENNPYIDNKGDVNPTDYKNDVLEGFQETYELFLINRDLLLSEETPLSVFKNCETRVVLRNTSEYLKLLEESNHPYLLSNEEQYNKYFSWLNNLIGKLGKDTILGEQDLLKFDVVPRFTVNTSAHQIYGSKKRRIDLKIDQSGYERVLNHIGECLTLDDMSIQINLIDQCVRAYANNHANTFIKKPKEKESNQDLNFKIRVPACIEKIAEMLYRTCIVTKDSICWTMLRRTKNKVWLPSKTDSSLYDGSLGILLALTFANKILFRADVREIIEVGIKMIYSELLNPIPKNCINGLKSYCSMVCGWLKIVSVNGACNDAMNLITNYSPMLDRLINVPCEYNQQVMAKGLAYNLMLLLQIRNDIKDNRIEVVIHNYAENLIKCLDESKIEKKDWLDVLWALSKYTIIYRCSDIGDFIKSKVSENEIKSQIHQYAEKCHVEVLSRAYDFNTIGCSIGDLTNVFETVVSNINITKVKNINLTDGLSSIANCFQLAYNIGIIEESKYRKAMNDILYQLIRQVEIKTNEYKSMMSPGLMTGYAGVLYQLLKLDGRFNIPFISPWNFESVSHANYNPTIGVG